MAAPVITHRKVSGKAQGPDLTRVYGNHWDDTHVITGLENVDNTSDANKPLSTADTAALALKAPLASPALTGAPTAPTAAVSTNTTQIATTAFVLGQLSNSNPLMDGVAAVGTSLLTARQDHVHPTDTSRASLTTNTFSGAQSITDTTASTSTTTGALKVSGGLGVAGAGWFGGNVNASKFMQTSSPSTSVAIDTSGGGAFSLTVANGASGAIAIQFGLLVLHEVTALGDVSFWLVSGVTASLIGQNGGSYVASTTTPAAGKISVAHNGTAFAIYNNRGGSSSFFVGQYQT